MRTLLASACLFFTALAPAQSQPPNAAKLTKYILGVADLDRSFAFYHALGLELQNNAPALTAKPNPLNDALRGLVDVPSGTKFRNMMLRIPNTEFPLEVTEFSGLDLHAAKPRIQDPGASLLVLAVDNIDAALAAAKKAGGEVVSAGGPVKAIGRAARVVVLKDPDGYYVELAQPAPSASGPGKVIGASFGTMVVADAEKAAAFYRDKFGFAVKTTSWSSEFNAALATPAAQVRTAEISVPGTALSWTFFEFKNVDRKSYTPRIPDPGAAGIGLQVRDIEAAVAAVKAAGGSSVTLDGSVKLGNGRVGFVRDPNGLLVELAQN